MPSVLLSWNLDTANEEVVSKTRKGKRGTGSGTEK